MICANDHESIAEELIQSDVIVDAKTFNDIIFLHKVVSKKFESHANSSELWRKLYEEAFE